MLTMNSFLSLLLLLSTSFLVSAIEESEAEPLIRGRVLYDEAQDVLDAQLRKLEPLAESWREDAIARNPRRKLWFLRNRDAYCKQIEESMDNKVQCGCRFLFIVLAYEFRCYSLPDERVYLSAFEGRAKYQGLIDFTPFQLQMSLKGKMCIDQATYQDEPAETLCVAGALCAGRGTGVCGCKVKYGDIDCPCTACAGGVAASCEGFVSPICVPLPLA